MSVRSYIIDDREQKRFLLDREVLVSEDVLRTDGRRSLAAAGSMSGIPPSSGSRAISARARLPAGR